MDEKTLLRQRILQHRRQLNLSYMSEAEDAISEQLYFLDAFRSAKKIAAYVSNDKEVDTRMMIAQIQHYLQLVYLPVIRGQELYFMPHYQGDPLVEGEYGIQEPIALEQSAIHIDELDVMIIPIVAFDKVCQRLGRGAGYYDRALATCHRMKTLPTLIGLAYEFQCVDTLPNAVWDIPMDYVITEEQVYTRARFDVDMEKKDYLLS